MKIKSKRIYSSDQDYLVRLRDEFNDYGGFVTRLEQGCLVIFARKHGDGEAKAKRERAKRRTRPRPQRDRD